MALDPNMQCVCGYRRFREQPTRLTTPVSRWVLIDDGAEFPFTILYGEFTVDQNVCGRQVVCEACKRVRSTVITSSGPLIYGMYEIDGTIYVVGDEIDSVGCLSLELVDQDTGETFSIPLAVAYDEIAGPIDGVPEDDPEEIPPGEVAEELLRAETAGILVPGNYDVWLIDGCCASRRQLGTIEVEDNVAAIPIQLADLNGAPESWRTGQWRPGTPSDAPQSGSLISIPFDKCDVVMEYDGRFGTLPDAQGWTGGDGTLVAGNVLRLESAASTVIWEQTVDSEVTIAPEEIHAYAVYMVESWTPDTPGNPGEGVNFRAMFSLPDAGPYLGVSWCHSDHLGLLALDDSAEVAGEHVLTSGDLTEDVSNPPVWHRVAAQYRRSSPTGVIVTHNDHPPRMTPNDTFDEFGASADVELVGRFGSVQAGGTLVTYIRNFVLSAPGRFIRTHWRSFAPSAAPVLRLYLSRDSSIFSSDVDARFLVRYGTYTTGSNPYLIPTNTVSVTATMMTPNQLYEVPLTLTGLTTRAPVWFTIERDWSHIEDTTRATVQLCHMTIRAS